MSAVVQSNVRNAKREHEDASCSTSKDKRQKLDFEATTKRNEAVDIDQSSDGSNVCNSSIRDLAGSLSTSGNISWREIQAESLHCSYGVLYSTEEANELFRVCEESITYNDGQLSMIKIFGKWHNIPRKQVAFGDDGLKYTFSNNTVTSRPWCPVILRIKQRVEEYTGYHFNFVLVNRYQDGRDHIGEHRDDEADLEQGYPIASLSLGQERDFVFKHSESRGKSAPRKIDSITILLQHGSLLLMKYPTNTYWYHSIPVRKKQNGCRINMTFRRMVMKKN